MKPELPAGRFNAHWLSFFTALSFQIMMGGPIIVYANSLGASSIVLGIIAALTPLMTIFQLPAAHHLNRYSYKQFFLMGWRTRIVLIMVIAALPLVGFFDSPSKLAALIALLFFVHLLRSISSVAWTPWMTHWIPEPVRGRFLSIDQFFMYCGSLVSLLLSGLLVPGTADPWEFSSIFVVSAAGATVGLGLIKRIPDFRPIESTQSDSQTVSWREVLAFRPFRELLIYNLIFGTVLGSLGVFTVQFLDDHSHFDARSMLYLLAVSYAGSLVTLPFCGRIADAVGSKPLMRAVTGIFAVVVSVWSLIAGEVLLCSYALVGTLNFLTGVATANFRLANARINMVTMPEKGRHHFFALFAVISNLGLGAAPIVWGMILETIGSFELETGGFLWRRHSIFFVGLLAVVAVAFVHIRRLHESSYPLGRAALLDREHSLASRREDDR